MVKPQRKTQAERRSESERSLLDAAIDVIVEQGVGAVTFESLGRTSGLSRGLVSHRFGSKQNLISALLNDLSERQEVLARERGLDDMPGFEAVKSYVDWCLQDLAQHKYARAYFMLLSSSVAEANAMRTGFQEVHANAEARLHNWIKKGQAEGAIRDDIDAGNTALMIGCLLFGFSMQLLVDPNLDVNPMRASCIAMLHNSLAQYPSSLDAGVR